MELTVKGADLAAAMTAVGKISPDRVALPILACVKLTAGEGALEMRATDLDHALSIRIPAAVAEPGSVAVSAKLFSGQAQALSNRDVTIKTDSEYGATLREKGGSRVKLNGMAPEEFPEMLDVPDGLSMTFKARSFSQAVRRVAFAAASDKNRYQLAGLRLKAQNGDVSLTATDGHRLAWLALPTEGQVAENREAILPADGMKALSDLLDRDGDVIIKLGSGMVGAEFAGTRFSGRLIEGQYPNVEGVMSEVLKGAFRVNVPVAETTEALQRAMLLVTDRRAGIKLSFKGTLLTVSLRNMEAGEAEFPVTTASEGAAPDFSIGVSGKYILEGFAQIATQSATLVLSESNRPMGIVGEGAPSYVVMPMTLA